MGVEGGGAVPGILAGVEIDGESEGGSVLSLDALHVCVLSLQAEPGVGLDAVDRLDADDVGPPLGEYLGDVGSRPDDGDGGDSDAFERETVRVGVAVAGGGHDYTTPWLWSCSTSEWSKPRSCS